MNCSDKNELLNSRIKSLIEPTHPLVAAYEVHLPKTP